MSFFKFSFEDEHALFQESPDSVADALPLSEPRGMTQAESLGGRDRVQTRPPLAQQAPFGDSRTQTRTSETTRPVTLATELLESLLHSSGVWKATLISSTSQQSCSVSHSSDPQGRTIETPEPLLSGARDTREPTTVRHVGVNESAEPVNAQIAPRVTMIEFVESSSISSRRETGPIAPMKSGSKGAKLSGVLNRCCARVKGDVKGNPKHAVTVQRAFRTASKGKTPDYGISDLPSFARSNSRSTINCTGFTHWTWTKWLDVISGRGKKKKSKEDNGAAGDTTLEPSLFRPNNLPFSRPPDVLDDRFTNLNVRVVRVASMTIPAADVRPVFFSSELPDVVASGEQPWHQPMMVQFARAAMRRFRRTKAGLAIRRKCYVGNLELLNTFSKEAISKSQFELGDVLDGVFEVSFIGSGRPRAAHGDGYPESRIEFLIRTPPKGSWRGPKLQGMLVFRSVLLIPEGSRDLHVRFEMETWLWRKPGRKSGLLGKLLKHPAPLLAKLTRAGIRDLEKRNERGLSAGRVKMWLGRGWPRDHGVDAFSGGFASR